MIQGCVPGNNLRTGTDIANDALKHPLQTSVWQASGLAGECAMSTQIPRGTEKATQKHEL